MNTNEAIKVMTLLAANYPHYYKNLSKDESYAVVTTWCDRFSDVPAEIVLEAVKDCISKCKFPPTIADVNEEIKKIMRLAGCRANDITLSQEKRSEAARLERFLYDLGFESKSRTPRNDAVMNLINMGGIIPKPRLEE